MAGSLTEDDEGSEWLYWDPQRRRWGRVELITVIGDNPRRVRVQHLDRIRAGAAEWVPASRCAARWAERDEYLAREERWRVVREGGAPGHVSDLAYSLLTEYVDDDVAEFATADGVLQVRDVDRLSRKCRIPVHALVTDPRAFREDDVWVLPWTVGEQVLMGLCRHDIAPGMRLLDAQTREHQDFDRLVEAEGPRWWQRPSEISDADRRFADRTRRWHENGLAVTQQLREWLDAGETAGLAQAYLELRGMLSDLIEAAREASPRLRMDRTQISERIADRLDDLVARPTPVVDVRGLRAGDEW